VSVTSKLSAKTVVITVCALIGLKIEKEYVKIPKIKVGGLKGSFVNVFMILYCYVNIKNLFIEEQR
jgi:hypothetical protein